MSNAALHNVSVLRPVVASPAAFFAAQQTAAAGDFDLAGMEILGTTRRRIKCGEPLYHAGENFTSIYIIRTGFFRSTMTLEDVLSPAIAYARDGHPLVERAHATIKTVEKLFREHWHTSAAVYLPGGKIPETGSLFTNKTLAATYTRVLREAESAGTDRVAQIEKARKVWSQGFVAEAIDRFCRTQAVMDTSGNPHKGVLTGDDMAKWKAQIEAPLTYDYGRYTVCKAPWSQGPVTLQQLALLKGFNLDGADVVGPDFIHTVVECSKLAYADREKFYGDPKFVDVPFETLLSDTYNAERRKLVTDKASLEFLPGSVEGFGSVVKLRRAEGGTRAWARGRQGRARCARSAACPSAPARVSPSLPAARRLRRPTAGRCRARRRRGRYGNGACRPRRYRGGAHARCSPAIAALPAAG